MGKVLSAKELKQAFLAGANQLNARKDVINELNVFPVPDGDTGTNMTMTILSAAKELSAVENDNLKGILKAMSGGALRGARGNSGVILSQLIRGFTKELQEVKVIDSLVLAKAFQRAVETAYKAVMKPKEGTILTVAKGMADKIMELSLTEEEILPLIEKVYAHGEEVLKETPELLPVLKEAGVVDSGGAGLMAVMEGALRSLRGEEITLNLELTENAAVSALTGERKNRGDISTADIRFGYCTEFMVNGNHPFTDEEVDALRTYLSGIGDSIVCFSDEDLIKVHVHTNHPGEAFEKGLTMGYLSKMKIDNMRLEHHEVLIQDASRIAAMEKLEEEQAEKKEHKTFGFIAVCSGEGLENIFRDLGVDEVVSGGQSMNPSTEDLVKAAEKMDADHIFILPNNKNIILAAEQVGSILTEQSLFVLPTKTIPQGISALLAFQPEGDFEENKEVMQESFAGVSSGEVTYAVRDTTIDGREIHSGDILFLGDHGLLSSAKDILSAMREAIPKMGEGEMLSLYYGADVKAEDAENLVSVLREEFSDLEIELQNGGQAVYYYIVSLE
ncbi:MAG: DAK2 domain-containing protein [Lachnospiraceae bacterium]|nr:DAK2 domain-containing protein [Lachnospiraceae bacterium]